MSGFEHGRGKTENAVVAEVSHVEVAGAVESEAGTATGGTVDE